VHLFDPRLEFCCPGGLTPPNLRPSAFDPGSGQTVEVVTRGRQVDPLTQTFSERLRWTVRDETGTVVRRVEDVLRLRWTYRFEMTYLFELTGFSVRACSSDFHKAPPSYGREQIWVVEKTR
jgi:hypothetical protein